MRILVTGASGFLGKTLIQKLIPNKELQIYGLSRRDVDIRSDNYFHNCIDLNNLSYLKTYMSNVEPDYVFHFAANPLVKTNSSSIIQENVTTTNNILSCCRSNFVFASSATVYGSKDITFDRTISPEPESLYAVTKLQSEELIKFYCRTKQIKSGLSIRYVAHVGKNSSHGVLYDLINKINKNSKSVDILGEYPGSTKPFLLAEESMSFTIEHVFSNKLEGYDCIDIAPSDSISVSEIVDRICLRLNIDRIKKNWLGKESTWLGDQQRLFVYSKYGCLLSSSRDAIDRAIGDICVKNTHNGC